MLSVRNAPVLFLSFLSAATFTASLSRSSETPKYFYQARSLIVCQTKCENECNNTVSIWQSLICNGCMQYCILKENMFYEDGPQDHGLILSVTVCCARLITLDRFSAKVNLHYSNHFVNGKMYAVLEYRAISDVDNLHNPVWSLSQITRQQSLIITNLECGYSYQFRITLITTRIIDRRTSSWISYRDICRYGVQLDETQP